MEKIDVNAAFDPCIDGMTLSYMFVVHVLSIPLTRIRFAVVIQMIFCRVMVNPYEDVVRCGLGIIRLFIREYTKASRICVLGLLEQFEIIIPFLAAQTSY